MPLSDVLDELHALDPSFRTLLMGQDAAVKTFLSIPNVEVFSDLDLLLSTFPDEGVNAS